MKYIVFGSGVNIDKLIEKGPNSFLKNEYPYEVMTLKEENDWIDALHKVEQYGSFCFISESRYNKLK